MESIFYGLSQVDLFIFPDKEVKKKMRKIKRNKKCNEEKYKYRYIYPIKKKKEKGFSK